MKNHTREGLRQSLEDEFDVYTAGNMDEALNVLDADHIDLVLTDLRLGGEDGMELIEKVLQRPRPPICMLMTAYGSIATAVEAMKRGAYDFVTKPVNIDELGAQDRACHQGTPDGTGKCSAPATGRQTFRLGKPHRRIQGDA